MTSFTNGIDRFTTQSVRLQVGVTSWKWNEGNGYTGIVVTEDTTREFFWMIDFANDIIALTNEIMNFTNHIKGFPSASQYHSRKDSPFS